jgi:thiol-disulfide isomerase/thioredoxin
MIIVIVGGLVLGLLGAWQLNRSFNSAKETVGEIQLTAEADSPVYNYSVPVQPNEGVLRLNLGTPEIGTLAPDFVLDDLTGKPVRLSDLRGSVVVINFWASWCDPCREEMPVLQAFYDQYADRGLVVLGVNATYTDSKTDAISFVEELGLTFPTLFDETGDVGDKLYKVVGLPTSYWIDQEGIIRSYQLGALTEGEMKVILSSLMEL